MNTAVLATYGNYNPHHQRLKKLGCSPCERDVFGKLVGLINRLGQAFVYLKEFATDLGYARETISRALTELEKKNLIKRTGEMKWGFFPFIEILPLPEENEEGFSISADAPLIKRSTLVDQKINEHCPNDQSQEKKTNKNKKQPEKTVCSKILEKNHLKESLKSFGIGANKAMRIMADFPLERIESQITNLKAEQARGVEIENAAGWLIKAIQKNFRPPVERITKAYPVVQIDQEEIQAEKSRKAQRLLQDAKHEERIGNAQESKHLAQKSLAMHRTREAEELINRIDAAAEKKAKQKKALAAMPKEEFERLLDEEIKKQKSFLARWSKREITDFHREAAYVAALARLAH